MRVAMLGIVSALLLVVSNPNAVCQENPQSQRPYLNYTDSPRLYFLMSPTESSGVVVLVASSAQRDLSSLLDLSSADTRTVLQLRGNVEVTMCSPEGHGDSHGCDRGSVVLHADAVDYNEKTGEMDVRGNVHIGPLRRPPNATSR
jgi:hypothetical protein